MPDRLRVVVAEDLFLIRDALVRILTDHDFTVVAAVDNGPALRRALTELQPDVAVVDVRLPPSLTDEGLQAVIAARRARPGFPVLVLSQYVEQLYARELLADGAGAVGYLLKDRVADTAQFVDAVTSVARGGTAMDPQVVAKLLNRSDARGRTAALSPREHEVLGLIAAGRSNAAIARQLIISPSAVTKHIAAIFGKLRLPESENDNRRVLAVLAHLDR
ncbi:DNA-binding response regulator [Nocardia panacis]|uniref:DNA-binding response regulator n=1 Tax=Nocardia panacis TaxID=2340916 RepID=A0A3A4JP36_9NOCA|nr:response regulator transcription factor [Nocardia panacis]RJO70748.1 DNA-binding response regulator [Nocardia panacis]